MRLLLVEDDAMIGDAVLQVLRAEHYAVDWVRDGAMADEALRSAANTMTWCCLTSACPNGTVWKCFARCVPGAIPFRYW